MLQVSAFSIAQRFIGVKETAGVASNAQVLAMLRLDASWPAGDDVAWCSAFVNYIAWLLRLPRSKSLAARSWLTVGAEVSLGAARADCDVVVLKRGGPGQPGPEVLQAQGHVGFFAGIQGNNVLVLGGNQADTVSVAPFAKVQVLGVRRLA